MRSAVFLLAFLPAFAFAYTPAKPARGYCYGLPQIANEGDGEEAGAWDGKTHLTFEMVANPGDALYHKAKAYLADPEGGERGVPFIEVYVQEGYRVESPYMEFWVHDRNDRRIYRTGTSLPTPALANQLGFNASSDMMIDGELTRISCTIEPGPIFPIYAEPTCSAILPIGDCWP